MDNQTPNPATARPANPQASPNTQTTSGISDVARKELVELQLKVDQSLEALNANFTAIIEDYNVQAQRIVNYYQMPLADIMTNRTLLGVLATNVKALVEAHPTSQVVRNSVIDFAKVSIEPLEASNSRLMLNGSESNS